jgi:hypothetical protein
MRFSSVQQQHRIVEKLNRPDSSRAWCNPGSPFDFKPVSIANRQGRVRSAVNAGNLRTGCVSRSAPTATRTRWLLHPDSGPAVDRTFCYSA